MLLFFSIPAELSSQLFNADIILITILVTSIIMTWGLIKFNKDGVEDQTIEASGDNDGVSYFVQRMSGDSEKNKQIAVEGDTVDLTIDVDPSNDEESDANAKEEDDKEKE